MWPQLAINTYSRKQSAIRVHTTMSILRIRTWQLIATDEEPLALNDERLAAIAVFACTLEPSDAS